MTSPGLQDELIQYFIQLDESRQRRVVDIAKSLAGDRPPGVSGENMAKLAGLFTKEDMAEIEKAIEEGCERVDENGW
ncbi:MAG TPA: hypothetical protein VNT79_16760 [Phycisphaerae bacterium]|nr:hypothetical protein [Phycisphaerae bacterium]